jgi:hypothetical protein
MIVRGSILKGMNSLGAPSLASIGDMRLWIDFRKAVNSIDVSGDLRVEDVTDLRSDLLLRRLTVGTRPLLQSDGFAVKLVTENNTLQKTASLPALACLHDGTPHLLSMIIKYDNPSNVGGGVLGFQTGINVASGGQGISFFVSGITNRITCIRYTDNSATPVHNHAPASNTLPKSPTDQLLVSAIYYGNGLSNNSKIWIGGTAYTATVTGTLSSLAPNRASLTVRDILPLRIQLITAYSLEGKSVSEIDAFYTNFITTLKKDDYYTSVITP